VSCKVAAEHPDLALRLLKPQQAGKLRAHSKTMHESQDEQHAI
jgi:hypothetical protein